MLPFGELIRNAFWISLRNRHLWLFGVFAGVPTFSFQGSVPIDDGESPSTGGDEPPDMLDPGLILAIVVALLVLALVYVARSATPSGRSPTFG